MATLPKSIFWDRTDTTGTDHVLFDDKAGLVARGVAQAVDLVPYTCRYNLSTDETWTSVGLEVSVEGAGWLRTLRLERAGARWRASTGEMGDLDAALTAAGAPAAGLPGTEEPDRLAAAVDVDLLAAPLFNTLPVRRLGLLGARPGTTHRITVVSVLLPGLQVVPAEQFYTLLGGTAVRFASETFSADLSLDPAGFVVHYPGLVSRAAHPR